MTAPIVGTTAPTDEKKSEPMEPDHSKLGADLSLMSFLKSGPTRRGVVNAINPMMPMSTSEVFSTSAISVSQVQSFRTWISKFWKLEFSLDEISACWFTTKGGKC